MSTVLKAILEKNNIKPEPDKMKILSYIKESKIKIVENYESKNPAILGRVEAILMNLNTKSQNTTYYDDNWYSEAIENNEDFQRKLLKKLILGEFDHPEDVQTSGKRTAFALLKYWRDGNNILGLLEIFNTTYGRDLWTLIQAGVMIGFSLRGLGNDYYSDGLMKIEGKNFELKGWDAVVDPSFIDAEIKRIVESRNTEKLEKLKNNPDPNSMSRYIMENIQKKLISEQKENEEKFENKQLRSLVNIKESKISELKTEYDKKQNALNESKKDIENLKNKIYNLEDLLKQHSLLLESKDKTIESLNSKLRKINEDYNLLKSDIDEKKLIIEKLKNEKIDTVDDKSKKIEVYLEKINKNEYDKKSSFITESINNRKYK